MADYPPVYSDVGAFTGLLRESGRLERFTRNFVDLLRSSPEVAGRLMYGSDWYMVASRPRNPEYYRRFAELMQRTLRPEAVPMTVGGNAVRFLGLRKGERNRERLDGFYRANNVDPAWRAKVDTLTVPA